MEQRTFSGRRVLDVSRRGLSDPRSSGHKDWDAVSREVGRERERFGRVATKVEDKVLEARRAGHGGERLDASGQVGALRNLRDTTQCAHRKTRAM